MPEFSVRRPYVVLVAVLALCVLGITGFTRMTTDFLPEMNLPYMVIVTSDPGASPQKVESEITNPVEDGVSTLPGIKNVTSTSAGNVSQVMLEFETDTNMDSAMVKVTSAVNQLELPDGAGKPSVMEVSMDMMPVLYVSVDKEGLEGGELSRYIEDNVVPDIKRQDGVASVQTEGMVQDSVQVKLNQKKIDAVNKRIRAAALSKLQEAKEKLDRGQAQLNEAKTTLQKQKDSLSRQQKKSAGEMAKFTRTMNTLLAAKAAQQSQVTSLSAYTAALNAEKALYTQNDPSSSRIGEIETELRNLRTKSAAAQAAADKSNEQIDKALKNYNKVEAGKITAAAAFGGASAQIAIAEASLNDSQKELEQGYANYRSGRKKALANANANQLLSLDTLSKLITAENFSMPAGYVTGGNRQYLVRIDEEAKSAGAVGDMVLTSIDGVGDITVDSVADVKIEDNGSETYARVNGRDAAVLAVYKASAAGTSAVSDNVNAAFDQMQKEQKGLEVTTLMDQGEYINVIISSVFSNLIWGAILAFLVLLLFLRDLRPTLVVAVSIPLSVLFTILLMYFSDISMNIISMSGLALGIGMLVDNSIVVMENIYRLRNQGVSAAQAAVQGAGQVAGAIASSTLTTICVFLPVLFTNGLTRELVQDMCLTITFSLLASLAVALTVVPSISATLMRNVKPKEHRLLERLMVRYERALRFCLRKKWVPVLLAVVLLGVCAARVASTGVVIIPEMSGTQISVAVEGDPEDDLEDNFKVMDQASRQIREIDGVKTVGAMQSATLSMGMMDSSSRNFTTLVLLRDDAADQNRKIGRKIENILDGLNVKSYTVSTEAMSSSSLTGSGLQVDIYGDSNEKILNISDDIMSMVKKEKGFENVVNGQEAADPEIVLNIDKAKAMRRGLTVAQIYQALAEKLKGSRTATQIQINGDQIDVNLKDSRRQLTKKNLLDFRISGTTTGADGTQTTKKYRLGDFATFKVQDGIASIGHDNGSRMISVKADTKDGYNTTLLSRKLEKKLSAYHVPAGYEVKLAGETESVNKMLRDMGLMMLVALILIYLIMVAQFANFLSPFIVMFTIPLAFTGGFLALMITGEELSMISLMGFLILSGVVVNNGIVFIDYANQMRKAGMDRVEALVKTGRDRMRPIMMTALTTILAMSVMALSHDEGAEMGRGMAIVTIGGLLYATLMTLFIVPVLYDAFYHKRNRRRPGALRRKFFRRKTSQA
ncbi:efflux RND transporter permease subunit [Hornefia butyriciproducens]|nr:efflux RND transporter permease subunit [Hornefia butyriciproducens]